MVEESGQLGGKGKLKERSADRVHAKLHWYGGMGVLAKWAVGEVAFMGKRPSRVGLEWSRVGEMVEDP